MIILQNADIQRVLDMRTCLNALEDGFKGYAEKRNGDRPNIGNWIPCDREDAYYRLADMEGSCASTKTYAIRIKSDILCWTGDKTEKNYCVTPDRYCGLIMLFSTANGAPLAILQDGYLQHMSVGACAGLGAKYLARQDSKILGIIGSGGMARTYLQAIAAVRQLQEVRVYSPNAAHREEYAEEMKEKIRLPVIPVTRIEEVFVNSDIVATCTDSTEEIVTNPAWIRPGMHLTNLRGPREWNPRIFEEADLVFRTGPFWDAWGFKELRQFICNVVGQPHEIARIHPWASAYDKRETLHEELYKKKKPDYLVDLMVGKVTGRTKADQVSFFTPMGLSGLRFASVSGAVYQLAAEKRLGTHLSDDLFLQEIRD